MTKFYHNFFTDLPDQFVEANADRMRQWADGWTDKNRYYRRSMLIDGVPIDFIGNATVNNWPTFRTSSLLMLHKWISYRGDKYNGRYWESLAEDQRCPDRVAGDPGRGDTLAAITWGAGHSLTAADIARAAARLNILLPRHRTFPVVFLGEEEKVRPPLKRDGVVAGEIIGYRCWRIKRGDPQGLTGLLRSVYQEDIWKPGEVLQGRELGDWDSRGIHAWKDSGSREYHNYIRGYLNQNNAPYSISVMTRPSWPGDDSETMERRPAMVTGTVFLWGDVVEHERGWRAEFARVRSLDWLYPDEKMMGKEQQALDNLRQLYGVSLVQRGQSTIT